MFQDVVAETLNLFFKNFSRYLLVIGIIAAPIVLLQINATIALTGIEGYQAQWEMQRMLAEGSLNQERISQLNQMQAAYTPGVHDILTFLGCLIAGVLLVFMLHAAGTLLTQIIKKGSSIDYGSLFFKAFYKIPGLFLMSLVYGLAVVAGMFLLVVPGIIIAVKFSLSLPAYLSEKISPFKALARSWRLTRGAGWTIFFIVLVIMIISFILGFALSTAVLMLVRYLPGVYSYMILMAVFQVLAYVLSSLSIIAIYLIYARRAELPAVEAPLLVVY